MRKLQRGSVSLASGLGILDSDTGVVIKPASDVKVGSMRELLAFCGQAIASYKPGAVDQAPQPREQGSGVSPIPLPSRSLANHPALSGGPFSSSAFRPHPGPLGPDSDSPRHPLRRSVSGSGSNGYSRGSPTRAGSTPSTKALSTASTSPKADGLRKPDSARNSPPLAPVTRQRSSSDADAFASPELRLGSLQMRHGLNLEPSMTAEAPQPAAVPFAGLQTPPSGRQGNRESQQQ